MLFAGNMLPTFAKVDGTDSLVERLHILIFDKSVEEDEIDNGMEDKLWAERNVIVRYALEQLKYFIIADMTFTKLDDEKRMLEEVARMSNPIQHFVESCIDLVMIIIFTSVMCMTLTMNLPQVKRCRI